MSDAIDEGPSGGTADHAASPLSAPPADLAVPGDRAPEAGGDAPDGGAPTDGAPAEGGTATGAPRRRRRGRRGGRNRNRPRAAGADGAADDDLDDDADELDAADDA